VAVNDRQILAALAEAVDRDTPVVLATVVATRRSVPRHAGTKMLIYGDGSGFGTVGGGAMESAVIDEAVTALRDGRTRLLEYALLDPEQGDPGVCGGEVNVYLEPYMIPHTVFVVGCGHVGKAVLDLAGWLGYRTVATDDRADMVTEALLPDVDVRLPGSIREALDASPITENTSVIVVTRSTNIDVDVIPPLLATPARYVGVMGSKRRWEITRRALADAGVAGLDRVHSPIGIDVNAETLEEIAVSILAEVIATNRAAEPSDP
jgi:xanthine dehydrogenase accessory factor